MQVRALCICSSHAPSSDCRYNLHWLQVTYNYLVLKRYLSLGCMQRDRILPTGKDGGMTLIHYMGYFQPVPDHNLTRSLEVSRVSGRVRVGPKSLPTSARSRLHLTRVCDLSHFAPLYKLERVPHSANHEI